MCKGNRRRRSPSLKVDASAKEMQQDLSASACLKYASTGSQSVAASCWGSRSIAGSLCEQREETRQSRRGSQIRGASKQGQLRCMYEKACRSGRRVGAPSPDVQLGKEYMERGQPPRHQKELQQQDEANRGEAGVLDTGDLV